MEFRSPKAPVTSFKELPIDLRSPFGGKIVHLQLPTTGAFGRTNHLVRKAFDDKTRAESLASSSGICFRAAGKYPRNILWRNIEEGSTLELRSVDWSKSATEVKEANVIIQLTFPDPIRKGCVGVADAERGDSVEVFVLTKGNDLYTISIRTSFFCQASASEEDYDRWCQSTRPSTLSSSQAFKLTTCTANELVFSLSDGRLVQLTRQSGGDGRSWTERVLADATHWSGSFRGLIGWQGQNKVRHDGLNLDQNTALAAQTSPDGKHLITATLNHNLKIWSLESGRPTVVKDLLNEEREPNAANKVLLDPGINQILCLESGVRAAFSGDKYYVITYSPHEGGSFKFWGIRDADFGGEGTRDMFPEETFRIPDPDDGASWTVADFHVRGDPTTDKISFWVMLRLNRRYQLFHKTFSSLERLNFEWNDEWERTAIDSFKQQNKQDNTPSEPHGLCLDSDEQMPWILSTVAASPVRNCTDTEVLVYNDSNAIASGHTLPTARSIEGGGSVSTEANIVIDATSQFRAGLDQGPIEDAIRTELWQDPSFPAPKRMQDFYDNAALSQVSDRDWDELFNAINRLGGEDALTDQLFLSILETFPDQIAQGSKLSSTSFGRHVLVQGATELVALQERIVCDLLCATVLIDQEVDRAEKPMPDLNSARIFEELIDQLRILQVMQWVSTNHTTKSGRSISILELLFAGDIRPQSTKHQSGSAALSGTIRDLIKWVSGGNDASITIDQIAVNVQCHLLAGGNLELATAFLRYQPSTSWATYVRGRYSLQMRDHISAATYFKKAAFKVSRRHPPASFYAAASAGLVETLELSNFASGLCNFYTHITHLFSHPEVAAHAQIVQFASLALQHFSSVGSSDNTAHESHRSDLLARLFRSALALNDYGVAFGALVRYTDNGLRKAALKSLITTMLQDSAASELVALPFTGHLKSEVDSLLTDMVRAEAESGSQSANSTKAVKVLYAWKVHQGDYRGAAACIIERLHAQKASKNARKQRRLRASAGKDEVLDDYLIAINALSMLDGEQGVDQGENEGWVFVENGEEEGGRSLVRLRDLRREYQQEMDLREKWERGRFALTAGDSDEEDEEDAMEM